MALKDLALFKLVSSTAKKTKNKIAASIKSSDDAQTGESVQETFKAVLKKDKIKTSKSDDTTLEKSDTKSKEVLKSEVAEEIIDESTPVKEGKEVKTAIKKLESSKKESLKPDLEKTTPVKKDIESKSTDSAQKSSPEKAKSSKKETAAKETKATAQKKTTGTKKEAKIKLYTEDVQKHYGSVDDAFLEIVVKNLGPSIYRKDAELVSCSDSKELDTVRNNFLVKKLGFDKSEKEMLDGEIQKVCETLKGTRTKFRATFYYILAKNLKKESMLS